MKIIVVSAGTNMPDISILIELSDFYDITIPEIVEGEKKFHNEGAESKQLALELSDYAAADKKNLVKKIRTKSKASIVALVIYLLSHFFEVGEQSMVLGAIEHLCLAVVYASPVLLFLYTTGTLAKIEERKLHINEKHGKLITILILVAIIVLAVMVPLAFIGRK